MVLDLDTLLAIGSPKSSISSNTTGTAASTSASAQNQNQNQLYFLSPSLLRDIMKQRELLKYPVSEKLVRLYNLKTAECQLDEDMASDREAQAD